MTSNSCQKGHRLRPVLRGRSTITGSIAGLAFALCVLAGQASASVSAPGNLASAGSISGLVTGHGHSLKGICVFATQVHLKRFYDTSTSKNGHYAIHSMVPDRYFVTFAGCRSNTDWLKQRYKGVNSPSEGPLGHPPGVVALRVKAGKALTGIDARLTLGASISGTVTSASTGSGANHICVNASSNIPDGFALEFTPQSGHYALHALFPGTYQLEFGCGWFGNNNFAPLWWTDSATAAQATEIKITGPNHLRNVDVKLTQGAAITGVVRANNASGQPLQGVCVSAASHTPGIGSGLVSTASDGAYSLTGLAAGKYKVTFDPDCGGGDGFAGQTLTVETTTATTVSGVNAYLQPAP